MRAAVYPGSFDPFTNGHLDIVQRASKLFDRVIVGLAINSSKTPLFTLEERADLIRQVTAGMTNVEVVSFSGLLTEFVRSAGATAVVRGIRAVTDFDYEYAMYQMNSELHPEMETVFLLARKEYSFLSSTIIKEIARYGKTTNHHVPEVVQHALLRKFGHL